MIRLSAFGYLHEGHVALYDGFGENQLAANALAAIPYDALNGARSAEPSPWLMLALGVTRETGSHQIRLVVISTATLGHQMVQRDFSPICRVKVSAAVLAQKPVAQVDGEAPHWLYPLGTFAVETFAIRLEARHQRTLGAEGSLSATPG
jgi:hypothetical protein